MLNNSVGVGKHPDIMDSIEKELEQIANYDDLLEVLVNNNSNINQFKLVIKILDLLKHKDNKSETELLKYIFLN